MNREDENIYNRIEPRLYKLIIHRVQHANYVLDIGCGKCKLVNILAKHMKTIVIGVDIDDSGFANGMKEAEDLGVLGRVKCIKIDAQFLTSAIDKKFEAAVSLYALHEYEKPVNVLQEVYRALKPGGKIILVDFLKGSTAEKLWDEDYYTEDQIKYLLKKVGFRNLERAFPEGHELVFVEGKKLSTIENNDRLG